MEEMRNIDNILTGNPERNTPLGRHRHRWEDNIRMDLRQKGWEDVDWIHLVHDMEQWWALLNTVMEFRIPLKAGNLTIWVSIIFSKRNLLRGVLNSLSRPIKVPKFHFAFLTIVCYATKRKEKHISSLHKRYSFKIFVTCT
jgi:hypothetical protein